jgi:hypothetical protein
MLGSQPVTTGGGSTAEIGPAGVPTGAPMVAFSQVRVG